MCNWWSSSSLWWLVKSIEDNRPWQRATDEGGIHFLDSPSAYGSAPSFGSFSVQLFVRHNEKSIQSFWYWHLVQPDLEDIGMLIISGLLWLSAQEWPLWADLHGFPQEQSAQHAKYSNSNVKQWWHRIVKILKTELREWSLYTQTQIRPQRMHHLSVLGRKILQNEPPRSAPYNRLPCIFFKCCVSLIAILRFADQQKIWCQWTSRFYLSTAIYPCASSFLCRFYCLLRFPILYC